MAGPSQRDSSWSLRALDEEAPSAMDNDNRARMGKARGQPACNFFFVSKVGPKKRKEASAELGSAARSVVRTTSFLPFPLQTWKVVPS